MEIADLMGDVVEWADGVPALQDRKPVLALTKLVMEEIPELLQNQEDELEYADVLILVLDYAHLCGIDPEKAVLKKLDILRGRKWEADPDTGVVSHV